MDFQDLCFTTALFEKMMKDAQMAETKEDVIALIKQEHDFFQEQLLAKSEGMKRAC